MSLKADFYRTTGSGKKSPFKPSAGIKKIERKSRRVPLM
jgi:hypothetical protein